MSAIELGKTIRIDADMAISLVPSYAKWTGLFGGRGGGECSFDLAGKLKYISITTDAVVFVASMTGGKRGAPEGCGAVGFAVASLSIDGIGLQDWHHCIVTDAYIDKIAETFVLKIDIASDDRPYRLVMEKKWAAEKLAELSDG